MAHQNDWDRGYHAGRAQGAVDADAKLRDLEQQLEKAKRANSRSQIKAQLTQAQAEIAALKQHCLDEAEWRFKTVAGHARLTDALRAVVEAQSAVIEWHRSGRMYDPEGVLPKLIIARAKLKETIDG